MVEQIAVEAFVHTGELVGHDVRLSQATCVETSRQLSRLRPSVDRFETRGLHHLGPTLRLRCDEPGEFRRRGFNWFEGEPREPCLDCFGLKCLADRAMK